MKNKFCILVLSLFFISKGFLVAQTKITVYDKILFYEGRKSLQEIDSLLALKGETRVAVPEGTFRKSAALVTTRLTESQLQQFGEKLVMQVNVNASCDNYDRIGSVHLVLVPKRNTTYAQTKVPRGNGAYAYSDGISEDVQYIELGRFITPFMNKNKMPDLVPYIFELDYISPIFRDAQFLEEYDFWIEFQIYGIPDDAHKKVQGCAGRHEVFFGSVYFETSEPEKNKQSVIFVPLAFKHAFNNYREGASDIKGQTIKTFSFLLEDSIQDARFVLVTSNHGANSGGEEYIRRTHCVYVDDSLIYEYVPGCISCEPFRKYNTQGNGIYGREPESDDFWQSFSNWCPGDKIDNRIIYIGSFNAGNHTFKIKVQDAEFVDSEGNFPLSLFLIGNTACTTDQ